MHKPIPFLLTLLAAATLVVVAAQPYPPEPTNPPPATDSPAPTTTAAGPTTTAGPSPANTTAPAPGLHITAPVSATMVQVGRAFRIAGTLDGPAATALVVSVNGQPVTVTQVGAAWQGFHTPATTGFYTIAANASQAGGSSLSDSVDVEARNGEGAGSPPALYLDAPQENAQVVRGQHLEVRGRVEEANSPVSHIEVTAGGASLPFGPGQDWSTWSGPFIFEQVGSQSIQVTAHQYYGDPVVLVQSINVVETLQAPPVMTPGVGDDGGPLEAEPPEEMPTLGALLVLAAVAGLVFAVKRRKA